MNWLKFKKLYFLISGAMIVISAYSIVAWGLPVGIDFTGGSLIEYRIDEDVNTEKLSVLLDGGGFEVSAIQTIGEGRYLIRLSEISQEERVSVSGIVSGEYVSSEELRFEVVGPSIGKELMKKTGYAIVLAAVAILLWIAYQFHNVKFGLAAILAMFHDTFILIGAFALLGHFINAEVDFLFVTAVLTTLSFSVHDTIVVFDRIREVNSNTDEDLETVGNQALTETMVRSLNNSFTIIFMLSALLLLGGTTIKWFAAALLIGTILGTYSSPFVAVPLLSVFDKMKFKK